MATVVIPEKVLDAPQVVWNKVRMALSSQHHTIQDAFEALRLDFSTQGGNRRLQFLSIIQYNDFQTLWRWNRDTDPDLGSSPMRLLIFGWFVQKTPARPSSVADVDAYFSVGPQYNSPNDSLYSHLVVPLKGVGAKAWGIYPSGMNVQRWWDGSDWQTGSGLQVSCTPTAQRLASSMPDEFNGITGFLIVG